jgi:hypothetical protein
MPSETERITHRFMDRLLEEGKLTPGPSHGYTEDGERRGTEENTALMALKRSRSGEGMAG